MIRQLFAIASKLEVRDDLFEKILTIGLSSRLWSPRCREVLEKFQRANAGFPIEKKILRTLSSLTRPQKFIAIEQYLRMVHLLRLEFPVILVPKFLLLWGLDLLPVPEVDEHG